MVGQTISHYKIIERLSEGGIGAVYRAENSKLDHTVSFKFLAPHLVSDEDVRKRFDIEAKAAALNHPNICHVYEIDEADGKTFVDGPLLAARIEERPMPIEEALNIESRR